MSPPPPVAPLPAAHGETEAPHMRTPVAGCSDAICSTSAAQAPDLDPASVGPFAAGRHIECRVRSRGDYFKINMFLPVFKITFGTLTRAGCPSPDTRPSGELVISPRMRCTSSKGSASDPPRVSAGRSTIGMSRRIWSVNVVSEWIVIWVGSPAASDRA
jgi:hypothetical protein